MVAREAGAKELERFLGIVGDFEQVIGMLDHITDVTKAEIDDLVPVFAAVDDDENLLRQFLGLRESQDLEQFVHGAEAAGEDNESFGQIREPELAHEEVVKLEVERGRDELVRMLLERELDVQANTLAPGLMSAEICGFHDARASAGGDDETVAAGRDCD